MSTDTLAGGPADTAITPDAGATAAPVVVSEPAPAPSPAPAPATPAAPAPTLAAADPAADPAKPVEATWPDDWRQKLAGEDKAYLKQLERFDSPAALAKSYKEAQAKIASGAVKTPLAKDATPEQVAAWRAENGVPEKPDGYEVKPEGGFVFGDADKPVLDSFTAFAHGKNWSPTQVNEAATWYAQLQEEATARQDTADAEFRSGAEDTLRAEWGGEYRRNLSTVQNFLASHAPDGVADRLLGGRMADGRRIGDDPAVLQFLVRAARDANPMASVVPAGTPNAPQAIGDELANLKKMMGDDRSEYWHGPKSEQLQARYRELKTAQTQMSARG